MSQVTLDDAKVKVDVEKVVFEEGRKYRMGFPLVNKEGKVRLEVVYHYAYNEKLKRRFIVPEDKELKAVCDRVMKKVKVHYVTPVVLYRTDKNGVMMKPIEWDVKPFVINNKTLGALKMSNEDFPMAEHDIFALCDDQKYQSLVITPSPKVAVWKQKDTKKIKEMAEKVALTMKDAVAPSFDDDTIRELMGMNSDVDEKIDEDSFDINGENSDKKSKVEEEIDDLIDE